MLLHIPSRLGLLNTLTATLQRGKTPSMRVLGVTLNNLILFTNPSARAGYDTRSIFKRSLTGLNSEFSFSYTSCLTKAEEHSLSYYLPIAGGRIIGFVPFPRVLGLCEMQSVSSRIWTRVAESISYDDNHYSTKQSDSEVIVMSEIWGIRSTPSLPSFPGPLWPGVVALDWI